MSTLPLNDIINIIVSASAVSTALAGFNIGLIVGDSTVISASDRTKEYAADTALADMLKDGFVSTDPEYKAASFYLSQSPRPDRVIIGRWDTSGTETITEALTACRAKNTNWYAFTVCEATKATVLLAAAWAETATPKVAYFYTTADADAKAGNSENVFQTLKDLSYSRSLGLYSATVDAVASIMGYAMGANTRLANSAYTLAYKKLVGVSADDLEAADVTIIKADNGNVYVNRGNTYNLFESGIMANGKFFDELINTDMLVNDIQLGIMDLLASVAKVPQTEAGVSQLVGAITTACASGTERGFLSTGTWTLPSFKSVKTGDMLPNGYTILADPISSQSAADRANRLAPPIYVLCKEAGAIHSLKIQITVNA